MNKEALRQPEVHTTLVPISLTLICPLCSACAAAGRADAGASTGSGPAGEQAVRHRPCARSRSAEILGSASTLWGLQFILSSHPIFPAGVQQQQQAACTCAAASSSGAGRQQRQPAGARVSLRAGLPPGFWRAPAGGGQLRGAGRLERGSSAHAQLVRRRHVDGSGGAAAWAAHLQARDCAAGWLPDLGRWAGSQRAARAHAGCAADLPVWGHGQHPAGCGAGRAAERKPAGELGAGLVDNTAFPVLTAADTVYEVPMSLSWLGCAPSCVFAQPAAAAVHPSTAMQQPTLGHAVPCPLPTRLSSRHPHCCSRCKMQQTRQRHGLRSCSGAWRTSLSASSSWRRAWRGLSRQ